MSDIKNLKDKKVLVPGGAGFNGSKFYDDFFINKNFTMMDDDIRGVETCLDRIMKIRQKNLMRSF